MSGEYTAQMMREEAHQELHRGKVRTAAMLRQAADERERCERLLGCTFYLEDGHTNIDHIVKHQLNYILRGDAGKGAGDGK